MCDWGTSETVYVTVPAWLSHTGEERRNVPKDVDACIAPIVRALNAAGATTVASCCGHGKGCGNIALADGRELVIAPNYEVARAVENLVALFPVAGIEIREVEPSSEEPGTFRVKIRD